SGGGGHPGPPPPKRKGARGFLVGSGGGGGKIWKRVGGAAVFEGHKEEGVVSARKIAPERVDGALVITGGRGTRQGVNAMAAGGRVAYPNGVEPKPKTPNGVKAEAYDGMPDPQAIKKLNTLIEAGPFEVHIAHTYSLDEAKEAHRALNKHYLGKLALRPR